MSTVGHIVCTLLNIVVNNAYTQLSSVKLLLLLKCIIFLKKSTFLFFKYRVTF